MDRKEVISTIGILGLGSIGRRHARILKGFNKAITIFANRTNKGSVADTPDYIKDINMEDFNAKFFDLVIISNPSSLHFKTLKEVIKIGNTQMIFVEKPFCLPDEINECKQLLSNTEHIIFPGNSLRFHPAIDALREIITSKELGNPLECISHFGSYMPNWHPYEDYRNSYASRRDLGGGVLLTSIHEIDLVCHLFGNPKLIGGFVDTIAIKDIEVEDGAHLLLTTNHCKIVNISLNFFQKPTSRFLEVCFEKGTVYWNFYDPFIILKKENKEIREKVDNRIDAMYEAMWKAILSGDRTNFEMTSVYNSLGIVGELLNKRG